MKYLCENECEGSFGEIQAGAHKRGLKPQIFRENRAKILPGKSGLFGPDWSLFQLAPFGLSPRLLSPRLLSPRLNFPKSSVPIYNFPLICRNHNRLLCSCAKIGAKKSTQTFLYKVFSNPSGHGRPHQKVRLPAAQVVGRNFLTLGIRA